MTYAGNIFNKFESDNLIIKKLMSMYTGTLASLLQHVHFSTLLEVGCGEGNMLQVLNEQGIEQSPVLSDVSHEILLTAREFHPDVPFVAASIFDLPFRNDHFDLVFVTEVLEHVEDPKVALREIARVCKKYALLSVPKEPIWRLLNILRLSYLRSLGNTPGHVQHWTSREFKNLLEDQFEILAFRSPFPWSMALCQKKNKQG